jgi:hypothetical protein
MTFLQHIFTQLRSAQLVGSAQAFSTLYVCKHANWYSYQRHVGSDFSCSAAIQCLRSVRARLACGRHYSADQKWVLAEVETQLLDHLRAAYHVAEVI